MLTELSVSQPNVGVDARSVTVSVTFPDGSARTARMSSTYSLETDGTPWQAATLPVAMARHANLVIAGGIDEVALENAGRVQQAFHGWHPDLLSQTVVYADELPSGQLASGVGCFFSGGVDSFYSALTHADEVTHLIFVTGFDIEVTNKQLAFEALRGAHEAARAMGKELIAVTTNLRDLGDDVLDWGVHYHGAALAAVGLALAETLGRVIIPSSYHREDLYPWGSHPDLDRWWSSSRVRFEHDAVDVTRPDKVREIAKHQVSLDHLRVCWENKNNAFNCGRCEKCIRTMINLRSVDALRRCKTLPTEVDAAAVGRLRLTHGSRLFAEENLRELEQLENRDYALEAALRRAVETMPHQSRSASLKRRIKALLRP
ncbi:hypothetical protein IFT73_16950 [Aeromicrobium sp. CFBP 8757]|uniref:hypothetical protein n=1 Tax=Aeromicrobium sp. CFBP 8757 TaxID=2775288 RepID=UPI0017866360|nr:hypothetical protein [Aeromicrobium sp. CFBP 8757]